MAFEPRRYDSRCPLKSYLRRTKYSKSTLRKIELIIRRGYHRKPRRQPSRGES